MARNPPFCMTVQDFVKEAVRQGCSERSFGSSAAVVTKDGASFILPSRPRSDWIEDSLVLSAVRVLGLSGFNTSEEALQAITRWAPSESEQT